MEVTITVERADLNLVLDTVYAHGRRAQHKAARRIEKAIPGWLPTDDQVDRYMRAQGWHADDLEINRGAAIANLVAAHKAGLL